MDAADPELSSDTKIVYLRWTVVTKGASKARGGLQDHHRGHLQSECPTAGPTRNCCQWCASQKPLSKDTNIIHLFQPLLELSHFVPAYPDGSLLARNILWAPWKVLPGANVLICFDQSETPIEDGSPYDSSRRRNLNWPIRSLGSCRVNDVISTS